MSVSPALALRRAIVAHLGADSALVALLAGAKIYDEAPRGVEPPYVLFAELQIRDWSTTESRGAEQLLTLAIVSTQRGTRDSLDLAQRVIDLLDEAPLILDGHALIDLRFQTLETRREQNGRFARANLRFRATTEYL